MLDRLIESEIRKNGYCCYPTDLTDKTWEVIVGDIDKLKKDAEILKNIDFTY